jgi:hypothetical protein
MVARFYYRVYRLDTLPMNTTNYIKEDKMNKTEWKTDVGSLDSTESQGEYCPKHNSYHLPSLSQPEEMIHIYDCTCFVTEDGCSCGGCGGTNTCSVSCSHCSQERGK